MTEAPGPGRPQRSRWRWVWRAALLFVAVAVAYVGVTGVQVVIAANQDERGPADAIVVLGAAQYNGKPSPVLQRRLDHALELFDEGVAPRIVLTGSKQPDDAFTEAFAGYRYLTEQGVSGEALVIVDDGSSTWESLAAARRVLDDVGDDQVVLVSDRYHNRRMQSIGAELGLDEQVSSVGSAPSVRQILNETARVSVGQVLGYRRLFNATG